MTRTPGQPFVVGPPGVGKSRWLASSGNVPTVSSDYIRCRLFDMRGVDLNEGAGILEAGGRAQDHERWLGQFDDDVLALSRELRMEGWRVELGGPLGLHLGPSEPAVCLLPKSPEVLLQVLRKRSRGDRAAELWMMRGGQQLIRQWCDEFGQRSWTHGVIRDPLRSGDLPVQGESMVP